MTTTSKESDEEFESQLECLGEKLERYITTSLPIKRENKNDKTITYKLIFLYSVRFMPSLLSYLADNLTKGLHNHKCKDYKSDLEYVIAKENALAFKCIDCNKNYGKI